MPMARRNRLTNPAPYRTPLRTMKKHVLYADCFTIRLPTNRKRRSKMTIERQRFFQPSSCRTSPRRRMNPEPSMRRPLRRQRRQKRRNRKNMHRARTMHRLQTYLTKKSQKRAKTQSPRRLRLRNHPGKMRKNSSGNPRKILRMKKRRTRNPPVQI